MSNVSILAEDIDGIVEQLRPSWPVLAGRRILIAGGAGFLGRYLVTTLDLLNERGVLERPCRIVLLDNFVSGIRDWIPDRPWLEVLDRDVARAVDVPGPVDYLIHAASIASPVLYNRLRLETIDAGVLGTRNLLELAREKGVRSMLFVSSSEVYGDPPPGSIPTPETYPGNVSCTGPRACYDEPKRLGETLCVNYAQVHRVPVKIARPFNVFGPGIRLDDGRVMPTFAVRALTGERLPVHGDGTKTRTFCYIADATAGLFRILLSDRNGEVYNLGTDGPEIEIRRLAELVRSLVRDEKPTIDRVVELPDVYARHNPDRRCPDLSKIRSELGYEPRTDLVTGLERFLTWVRGELGERYGTARVEARCRVCGTAAPGTVLSLGSSPLANGLLTERQTETGVPTYPLELTYCPACHACQLSCSVEPDEMFGHYPYVSSTTRTFREHFRAMASALRDRLELGPGSVVVDVGSNDGLLLRHFRDLGIDGVGVEPAANIVALAREAGIETFQGYFGPAIVDSILALKGPVDLVTANNVFAHTTQIDEFVDGVRRLLRPDGTFVLEVQYLLDTLRDLTFDNIYHEHVSYFSVLSLRELFRRRGMDLVDVAHVDSHGGSLRCFVRLPGIAAPSPTVERFLAEERAFGLDDRSSYEAFANRVVEVRTRLRGCLEDIQDRGESLVGYGAPAKATTLLNYCGIGRDELAYVVDDNPLKQGLFIPGANVPIRGRQALVDSPPDHVLVLAWNFADEIIANQPELRERGTRFVVPLPELRVI